MIINIRSFDCYVNSPHKYQRKCLEKRLGNMDTDVRMLVASLSNWVVE